MFVKNSSHPRLSTTAKHRKCALLMVHHARTLTVPLRLSLARVFVLLCVIFFQRVENKLQCASCCDAPFRVSHLFPSLPMRSEIPVFARKDAHCVYCTGTAWIDRLNDNLLSPLCNWQTYSCRSKLICN